MNFEQDIIEQQPEVSPQEVLSRLRRDTNLSQADLGAIMGVTNMSVHRWETGKEKIPGDRAKQIVIIEEEYKAFQERLHHRMMEFDL